MNYQEANKVINAIEKTSFLKLKDDLYKKAIRYAQIRSDWYFLSIDDRADQDLNRTAAHNTFIDACNILSKNMSKIGEDNSWRPIITNDRKIIGDFACYLHCIIGITLR